MDNMVIHEFVYVGVIQALCSYMYVIVDTKSYNGCFKHHYFLK